MQHPYAILAILTFINLFNYIDRFVLVSALPEIQKDLMLNDTYAGLLAPAFIIVYAVACPLFGYAGDHGKRRLWLALGVGLWSVATGLAGFAEQFGTLVGARSFVGIGEAAYGTIAPALIGDCFKKEQRSMALSVFLSAIPIGSAMGYLLGGVLGAHWGWRNTFFIVGFPGLLLALSVLFFRDPKETQPKQTVPLISTYILLWQNRLYRYLVLGFVFYTFSIGGLAFWLPSYMIRARSFSQAQAGLWSGVVLAVCGMLGTLCGGYFIRFVKPFRKAFYVFGIGGTVLGIVLSAFSLLTPSNTLFLCALGLAAFCLFLNSGPINALILDANPEAIRTTAVAVSVFCIHIFGDAISPAAMGVVSEMFDLETSMLAIVGVFVFAAFSWIIACRDPKFSSE